MYIHITLVLCLEIYAIYTEPVFFAVDDDSSSMRTPDTNGTGTPMRACPLFVDSVPRAWLAVHCKSGSNQTSGTWAVAFTAASSSCRGTPEATLIQTRCKDSCDTEQPSSLCLHVRTTSWSLSLSRTQFSRLLLANADVLLPII